MGEAPPISSAIVNLSLTTREFEREQWTREATARVRGGFEIETKFLEVRHAGDGYCQQFCQHSGCQVFAVEEHISSPWDVRISERAARY